MGSIAWYEGYLFFFFMLNLYHGYWNVNNQTLPVAYKFTILVINMYDSNRRMRVRRPKNTTMNIHIRLYFAMHLHSISRQSKIRNIYLTVSWKTSTISPFGIFDDKVESFF